MNESYFELPSGRLIKQDDIIYVLKAEKDVEKLTFYDCILRIFNEGA